MSAGNYRPFIDFIQKADKAKKKAEEFRVSLQKAIKEADKRG